MLRPGQVLFTYLHLAPTRSRPRPGRQRRHLHRLRDRHRRPFGGLPLLAPMSEVAGRMSIQAGAHCLEKRQGGAGMLLGGVPGVPRPRWSSSAAAWSATNAIEMAVGLGADVTVLDRNLDVLAGSRAFGPRSHRVLDPHAVEAWCSRRPGDRRVLVPARGAPKLVTAEMVGA
jgi:alanine dehydrogenase